MTAQPERILKELGKLWTSEGKKEGEAGVLKACSMNLIVATGEDSDASAVWETVDRKSVV